MPHKAFLILIALCLGSSFAAFNGIMMLVAPARHERFLSWMSGMGKWSEIFEPAPERGIQMERRLAGLGIAAMGIYMVWLVWKG